MPTPKNVQPLDEIDRRIVEALRADGRTPNNELARIAGIAPSTCLARLRALWDRGVLRGIHADVDPESLGLTIQAMIAVSLRSDSRSAIAAFSQRMSAHPAVQNVFFVSGSYDFLVHVATRGGDELRELVVDELSARPEVAGTETHLIFDHLPGRARPHDV